MCPIISNSNNDRGSPYQHKDSIFLVGTGVRNKEARKWFRNKMCDDNELTDMINCGIDSDIE